MAKTQAVPGLDTGKINTTMKNPIPRRRVNHVKARGRSRHRSRNKMFHQTILSLSAKPALAHANSDNPFVDYPKSPLDELNSVRIIDAVCPKRAAVIEMYGSIT